MLDKESCAFCGRAESEKALELCTECRDDLNRDRLAEEALLMEKDGILTEEDDINASITGC